MTVKAILARLYKERRAIDKAIFALEKIGVQRTKKRRRAGTSLNSTVLRERALADIGHTDADRRTKIICFPRGDRTA